jgi:hypothetical protein
MECAEWDLREARLQNNGEKVSALEKTIQIAKEKIADGDLWPVTHF